MNNKELAQNIKDNICYHIPVCDAGFCDPECVIEDVIEHLESNKVYQVHREGGQWEDSYDYIVGTYSNKEAAENHVAYLENSNSWYEPEEYSIQEMKIENDFIESEECII